MNNNFTLKDAEWSILYAKDTIQDAFNSIKQGSYDSPWLQGRMHLELAIEMESLGQCFSAIEDFAKAKGAYRNAVIIYKWFFDRYFLSRDWTPNDVDKEIAKGTKDIFVINPQYLSSTSWNKLLLSNLFCSHKDTVEYCRQFGVIAERKWSLYQHIPDGRFFGRVIASLLQGNYETAKYLVNAKPSRVLRSWKGIPECLEAITNRDEPLFCTLLKSAYSDWYIYYSRHKGDTDAACFIDGIGLIKLAETVFHKHIYIRDIPLPYQLLDKDIYPEDTFPIPDYVCPECVR